MKKILNLHKIFNQIKANGGQITLFHEKERNDGEIKILVFIFQSYTKFCAIGSITFFLFYFFQQPMFSSVYFLT